LGNKVVRIFQTVFFEKLLCGATVSTAFQAAKNKLKHMADTYKKEAERLEKLIKNPKTFDNKHDEYASRAKRLTKKEKMLNEEVQKYLLLPADGNHDVSFSFRPYFPPTTTLKTWIPAHPNKFYLAPFCKQLKWANDHYLQLRRNLYAAMQHDHETSMRHRWVQITGPKRIGKTSVARYIAWRLSLYDKEGPDGIFWVAGGKSHDEVMLNFIKRFPKTVLSRTEKSEKHDPCGLMKEFFAERENPPTLLIIDDADDIKAEDRVKLFENLMNLNPRLHILTTSLSPIQVRGFDSNKADLKLEVPRIMFRKFFQKRADEFQDYKFQTLVKNKMKPYHFSTLWDSEVFKDVHRNPRTAILLVEKIHEMGVKEIKKSFLVDAFNKLVEEKAL